ncbi:MAG: M43 family zinc metalloprotease [Flavobacteriales bacterium]
MKNIFVAAAFAVMSVLSFGQSENVLYCGQVGRTAKLFEDHPGCSHQADIAAQDLEQWTQDFISEGRGGSQEIYIIPVVFHIIHNNGPENISDDQVYDAINVLNRDFRMLNEDISVVIPEFAGITADIGIEFRLASLDPDGNCHSGINRVQSTLTTEGGDQMKALSIWPRDMYMNVWVCADAGDGTAGYTFTPNSVNGPWGVGSDGIVLRHDYTGSIGTSSIFRSRTLTHECGHWLNLRHTWGPTNSPGDAGNCDFDDNVDDTPNTVGYTACDLDGESCGSLDNVQNYMEYSYCSRMFTLGQRDRMRAAITSNIAERSSLITQENLEATGVLDPALCVAKYTVDQNSTCVGLPIQFHDRSYHGVTFWSWNFGDGTSMEGSDPEIYKNPTHIYETAGNYTVVMTVSNSASSLSYSVENLITILDYETALPPFAEGFEDAWPNEAWVIFNQDGDLTWEITPSASVTGSRSLKLRNFSASTGEKYDELLSTTYDMSAMDTIYMTYHWAYANKLTETEDRLRIQVSGDCGQTWNTRRTRTGFNTLTTANATNAQFTPTTDSQWSSETLMFTNSDWMTEGFRVRFEFTGRGGNNFFLDDINITASDTVSAVIQSVSELPNNFTFNIYPNPAKENALIKYNSVGSERVTVEMYNNLGQRIAVIADEQLAAGNHIWELPHQSAGVYMVVFSKNGFRKAQKVIFE